MVWTEKVREKRGLKRERKNVFFFSPFSLEIPDSCHKKQLYKRKKLVKYFFC